MRFVATESGADPTRASDLAGAIRRNPAAHRIGDHVRILNPRGGHPAGTPVGLMMSAEFTEATCTWTYWVRVIGHGVEMYAACDIQAVGDG